MLPATVRRRRLAPCSPPGPVSSILTDLTALLLLYCFSAALLLLCYCPALLHALQQTRLSFIFMLYYCFTTALFDYCFTTALLTLLNTLHQTLLPTSSFTLHTHTYTHTHTHTQTHTHTHTSLMRVGAQRWRICLTVVPLSARSNVGVTSFLCVCVCV